MLRIVFLLKIILVTLLLLSCHMVIKAQSKFLPPSQIYKFDYSGAKEIRVSHTKNQWLEEQLQSKELPKWAGFSVETSISPTSANDIINWPNGYRSWIISLASSASPAVGVVIQDINIPPKAKIYVYSEENPSFLYSISKEELKSTYISTPPIIGENLIVEYSEPWDSENSNLKGTFTITDFIQIYNGLNYFNETKDLGDSDDCQVNINCSPEGDNWQTHKRGIARILLKSGNSWYWCSGTMINNTTKDGTPYFLTAYHCGSNASESDRNVWQFYFNYERPNCENTGTPPNNMITGAKLKSLGSIDGGSDFQLLELNSLPQADWNVYYNGWDRTTTVPTGGASIHHPSGDAKKISITTKTATSASPNVGGSQMASNSAWRIVWTETQNGFGVTEGGSSGAPFFNNDGLVVGTLSGGAATCSNPTLPDYYGKFEYHWQSNGSTFLNQLKPWLDPGNTGATKLDGIFPSDNDFEVIFSESFENSFPPTGWTLESSASNTWQSSTGYNIGSDFSIEPQDGERFAYVRWQEDDQNEWLISPEIDISQKESPYLTFYFNGSYHWSVENDNCDLIVMARKTSDDSWEELWNEHQHNGFSNETTYTWIYTEVDLQDYKNANALQLAFVYQGNDGANFNVDNILLIDRGAQQQHTLTINIEGEGSIDVDGETYEEPLQLTANKVLTLKANPSNGWAFSKWEDDISSNNNPEIIFLNSNKVVTAIFTPGSSTDSESSKKSSIYPNPFSNSITISGSEHFKRFVLTNLLGQTVLDMKFDTITSEATVNISFLSQGIYIGTIYMEDGSKSLYKLVKE